MNKVKLKIVGHVPEEKPDKDGFTIMRAFSNDKGTYSLKRWNDVGNWTLQKQRHGRFSWITLTEFDADSIIRGDRRTIDTDIIQRR